MRFLIGMDDTDDAQGPGTGYRARQLGELVMQRERGVVLGITRHQLLVAPEIPCTSNNSSACLVVDTAGTVDTLAPMCRDYLLQHSAQDSDVGLCIAEWSSIGGDVQGWGRSAKESLLTFEDARALACRAGVLLEGLTGTRGGIIGALAAVGLRATGDDGRFIWLPGARELRGVSEAGFLCETTGIDVVSTLDGAPLSDSDRVDIGDWVRPVLRGGQAHLLVEPAGEPGNGHWRVVSKEITKALSN